MKDLNNLNKEVEIKQATPKIRQPEQDNIVEEPVKELPNQVVYVSMQHMYPPIEVFNLKEFNSNFGPVFTPTDSFEGVEKLYINNRYRDVVLLRFNELINIMKSKYFKITEDLFSLLGPDKSVETSLREYEIKSSRKTFLYLLREALREYTDCDGKILYTRFDWLEYQGPVHVGNHSSALNLHKYRFVPNWVDWMRGDASITEEKVILPFTLITEQSAFQFYAQSHRFSQNVATQTFYSRQYGASICEYVAEYPFIYSFDVNGDFTDASAIFELKDTYLFELIFARVIARFIKRNLDIIQLPGNIVSFNLDNLIQELNERIEPRVADCISAFLSGQWNSYNATI